MSVNITTAFVQQYSANIMMLVQQKGSKLRDYVNKEPIVGKQGFFDQIGATAARRRPSRHSDTPRMDTPHARRRLVLEDWDWADLIDDEDKVRMLIDPASSYANNGANALGRSMDGVIIDAMRGTAFTGETGSTSVPLPAGQKVAQGGTGLTKAKLLAGKRILDAADVPAEGRHVAMTAAQLADLLNVNEVTNVDFNTVKALVDGTVDQWLGMTFHQVNGLREDGTKCIPFVTGADRAVMMWQQDNVNLGVGGDVKGRITERDDKNYATQVFASMQIGATRMQEEAVVEISCLET